MQTDINAHEFYQQKITSLQQQLKILYKKRSAIAWLRFAIFIAACFSIYFLWSNGFSAILTAIVCAIILFLIAVSKDTDNKSKIKNLETILRINNDEINYLHQNFSDKYNGKELEPSNHAYAKDLDIFGQSSLFQYINRCNAEQAVQLFSERLLKPLDKEKILQQQNAVKEISSKINWWQQFQAFGVNEKITIDSEKRIGEWLKQDDKNFTNKAWKLLLYIYPVITLACFYLFLDDVLPAGIFSLLVLIFFMIGLAISRKIGNTYNLLSKLEPIVSTLYNQLDCFEKENFNDTFLLSLKNSLGSNVDRSASSAIKHLQQILTRFDARLNMLAFFILNTFFLWDLWQIIALNEWKKANKPLASNWFKAIAQLEVAGSFATLSFNNDDWCCPEIADEHFTLSGKAIGHPLILKQQSVTNDFSISGTARVDLITGSNMAGKSTFLRSLGINMILAYAGSCVCAKSFTVSVATLMSSMRIEDNLAENTSTFYAELKKLKSIIDAVNERQEIFILLDEILRGTNSIDRHTGSKALIEQLIKKNAVAIIATHDIELSKLENDFSSSIKNYHFDVQVNNEKLFFDYKLKEGICRSMNASILMKQIGIEMPPSP
ncbi:MAG TPA: hypothetical protein VHB70_05895 [Parafilimonas sp.]|nr:hypothetical protein [Parafilimonas sp.]